MDARAKLDLPCALTYRGSLADREEAWLTLDDIDGPTLSDWAAHAAGDEALCNAPIAVFVVRHAASALQAIYDASDSLPGGLAHDIVIAMDGTVRLGSLGELDDQPRPSEADQVADLIDALRCMAGRNRPRTIDVALAQMPERRLSDLVRVLSTLGEMPLLQANAGSIAALIHNVSQRDSAPLADLLNVMPQENVTEPTQPARQYTPDNRPSDQNHDPGRHDGPGDVIGGTYKLTRAIGVGAMGQVFEAKNLGNMQRVAVKIVRSDSASDGEFTERFRREAQTMSMLDHPNIVSVYDYGSRGTCWLAMECIDGPSLAASLQGASRLDVPTSLQIARQVADALRHAHDRGIVHRDVKPANILLANDKPITVKLCDFGLAKSWDDVDYTVNGTLVGTPQYMSPEQCFGQTATHSSDLYGVGIILFRMITGHTPFESHIGAAVLLAHTTQEPPSLTATLGSPVPSIVQDVVDRCLQKDPDDRYISADLLIEDLSRCIARIDNPQHPTPALTFHSRRSRNSSEFTAVVVPRASPAPWVFAAIAVVALIALAIGLLT